MLDFGDILKLFKANKGMKFARNGWNGKGMWIELQVADENSEMTGSYIVMVVPKGSSNHFGKDTKDLNKIPWLPGHNDILAEDWNEFK